MGRKAHLTKHQGETMQPEQARNLDITQLNAVQIKALILDQSDGIGRSQAIIQALRTELARRTQPEPVNATKPEVAKNTATNMVADPKADKGK